MAALKAEETCPACACLMSHDAVPAVLVMVLVVMMALTVGVDLLWFSRLVTLAAEGVVVITVAAAVCHHHLCSLIPG